MISEYKNSCLIGYTGLIGQTLIENNNFNYLINSLNLNSIVNKEIDFIICAAPSAVKWKINIDDSDDLKNIKDITSVLSTIKCKKIILCSSIDAYGLDVHCGFNEDNIPNQFNNHNYGRNKILFENNLKEIFKNKLTIIRLSGLFGKFLKKNLLFDIKTNNLDMLSKVNLKSSFQWYNLNNLSNDLIKNIDKNLINLVNEPVFNYELFDKLNISLKDNNLINKTNYNIKTKFKNNDYILDKNTIIKEINDYLTT